MGFDLLTQLNLFNELIENSQVESVTYLFLMSFLGGKGKGVAALVFYWRAVAFEGCCCLCLETGQLLASPEGSRIPHMDKRKLWRSWEVHLW